MELDEIREYCLARPDVTEGFPFGEDVLVFKVRGKLFCLANLTDTPSRCNLKCEPERAVELRESHDGIIPGWHMNKKHWNTVVLDGSVPSTLIEELVEHSYQRVILGLKKKDREELRELDEAQAS